MPHKTKFKQAEVSSVRRRANGFNILTTQSELAIALAQVADTLHEGGNTQSTTTVGMWYGVALVARQGGTIGAGNQVVLENAFGLNYVIVNHTIKPESGLHAEMMIIRYLVEKEKLDKRLLGAGLTIGVTKGCCLDCAGWLNRYRIPHNIPPNGSEAQPSNQWIHPVTGAKFSGKKALKTYFTPRTYKSLGMFD